MVQHIPKLAWSGSSTDSGDLSVSTAAALKGSKGLQAVIDDTNVLYVTDDTPNAEPRYRARFYFDPNSIAMANGDAHIIFRGIQGSSTIVARVEFAYNAGTYQVRAALVNDGSTWTSTSYVTLSDASHAIEFDWQAAASAGANNGGLALWIDGVQQATLTGIDNDTRRVDRARLGALANLTAATSGTYYFDAFESRRSSYIGLLAGAAPSMALADGLYKSVSYNPASSKLAPQQQSGLTATFVYDGDGKRVAQTLNGVTTYFIGGHYEVTGSTVTKYYFAGAQRVAMRQGSTLYYLLGDHLGSTSLTTNTSGAMVSELRYKAWGEARYSSGTTPTKYQFTGEYSNMDDFGLMFYNARWYDPCIMQFNQPDTLITDQYNTLDWNRYSYARYNPLRYIDPTGHTVDCGLGDNCRETNQQVLKARYQWHLRGRWKLEELDTIYQTGRDIENYADGVTGGNGLDWMHYAFGNTTIEHVDFSDGHSDTLPFLGKDFGPRIRLNDNWLNDAWGAEVVFAHELGHVWDINSGFVVSGELNRELGGSSWCFFCSPGDDVPRWRPEYHNGYGNSRRNEYFAEAFSATVYNPTEARPGISQGIKFQMLIDVTRYLFPRGIQ